MNEGKQTVTGGGDAPRVELRKKQDRIIVIAERRGFASDLAISSLQYGAPTVDELRKSIYPDFVASIDSFLSEFDRD